MAEVQTTHDVTTNGHRAEVQIGAQLDHRPPPGPEVMALLMLLLGTIPLGLTQVGFVPPAAQGAVLPFAFAVAGLGLVVSSIWAAALRSSFDAAVFLVFGTLELGSAALNLGLAHGWYGIPVADIAKVQEMFFLTFTIVVFLLVVLSAYTNLALTLFFAVIDLSLLLSVIGAAHPSVGLTHVTGVSVFAFDAIGAYLLLGAGAAVFHRPELPVGPALWPERGRPGGIAGRAGASNT